MNRGFFLLEISIALAICLGSIALLVPSMQFFQKTLINMHLENIKSLCCYLHQKSIIERNILTITIDHTALHTPSGSIALSGGVTFGLLPGVYGPPSGAHTLLKKASSFVNDTIYFYPDGTISAGALYLVDHYAQWQYALTISIDKGCSIRKYVYNALLCRWHPY